MCSKPLVSAQELGSVFPNGPPSMRSPGVIDFVVIDKKYATEGMGPYTVTPLSWHHISQT